MDVDVDVVVEEKMKNTTGCFREHVRLPDLTWTGLSDDDENHRLNTGPGELLF